MIPRIYARAGESVRISGNAYDFGHAVAAIQFSLDEGEHWTAYETPGTNDYQNVTWEFECTFDRPGSYVLHVRSVNDEGKASPEAAFVALTVE